MRKNGRRKAKSCEDMYFARVLAGSFWCLRGHVGWSSWVWRFPGCWEGKNGRIGSGSENLMKLPMHGDGEVARYFVNLGYSVRIFLISDWPHGHVDVSWGKNVALYSPIGAWFRIALVALAHREMECPRWDSIRVRWGSFSVLMVRKFLLRCGCRLGQWYNIYSWYQKYGWCYHSHWWGFC